MKYFFFHLLETKPKMIVLLDFFSPFIVLVNEQLQSGIKTN